MSQIIKGHNEKIIQKEKQETLDLNVDLRQIVPSMVVAERKVSYTNVQQQPATQKKVYLGLTEGEFKKQRYYDHVKSFKNEFYANSTTLSRHVWELKKKM